LTDIGIGVSQTQLPDLVGLLLLIISIIISVAQLVFVFWLAIKVYNTSLGVILGILAMVPCVGLIILLVVNQKAISVLTANGHKVGLMGADLAEFPAT
jgi:hypothetical protein